jgi:hypothetical protein
MKIPKWEFKRACVEPEYVGYTWERLGENGSELISVNLIDENLNSDLDEKLKEVGGFKRQLEQSDGIPSAKGGNESMHVTIHCTSERGV